MKLPDLLTEDPHGHIHVTGHRIGLEDLVYYYSEGYSPEMLRERFPTLSLALIHKVIAFFLENRTEADAYVAAGEAEIEWPRANNPLAVRFDELRRRVGTMGGSEKP
jgi:uncharacterized protein (DUF433 family)